nr:BRO family protein [Serratia ureilytica]
MSRMNETRQCANTNRVSVSETLRETNMKSIANSELNFHGINLSPVAQMNDIWLTSADLAKALGYASSKSVSTIYSRNSDEFTGSMSMVIKMMTNGINNNLREKSVRVFSLRGCHLIAMFATTDKAKEFRRWVLDILDREVAQGNVHPAFDFEMYVHNANAAYIHMRYIYDAWMQELHPALKKLGSPLAVKLYDRIKDATAIVGGVKHGLEKASGLKGLQY